METNIISPETQLISFKIRLPYQIIGILFGIVGLVFLVSTVSFSLYDFVPTFLIYSVAFFGLNGIIAYGFWKMRKWIITLLGAMTFLITISIVAISGSNKNINQAIAILVVFGALFLFTYFSRKFLNGDYKNPKALGLFLIFLIISQVITFFIK